MDNATTEPHATEHKPRILARVFYNKSKLHWCVALSLKVIAAAIGILLVLTHFNSPAIPVLVFGLAVFSEFVQWRSDVNKGCAESLTRKIEYHNGFNWNIADKDVRDNLLKVSAKTRKYVAGSIEENYFASQREVSPKRAIENLRESAWWSSHLTGTMIWFASITLAVLLLVSLVTLIYAIGAISDKDALASTSRVVTATLSLLLSLGFFKLISGYTGFKLKLEQVEQSCANALKSNTLTEVEALRLLHEYHLARASAPLIPDIVWKMRKETLNELWSQYPRD